jgi:hypothetical protein
MADLLDEELNTIHSGGDAPSEASLSLDEELDRILAQESDDSLVEEQSSQSQPVEDQVSLPRQVYNFASNALNPVGLMQQIGQAGGIDPEYGRMASAALGAMLPALAAPATGGLSLVAAPATAALGGQLWDSFTGDKKHSPFSTFAPEVAKRKPVITFIMDWLYETSDNALWDLGILGLGGAAKGAIKGINSKIGKTATMNRTAQSPEAFSGLVGQGIRQTNVSEGEAKQLAKVVDNLVESNVFFGKKFDPQTAKFVGDVGEETLEQMRDRLGKGTLSEIAQARNAAQNQLDDVMLNKFKLKPIYSQHIDTTAADDLIARLSASSENAEKVAALTRVRDGFLADFSNGKTFAKAQDILRNQYDEIARLKGYDPATAAQLPKSAAIQEERELRTLLAESLRSGMIQRADEISVAAGIKAPTGGPMGAYIDKLNDIYAGVKTFSDDIDSFITRQISGGVGNRPASSFVQTDLSQVDPRSPLGSLWRPFVGNQAETIRRAGVFKQLDKTIPSDIRTIAKIRSFGPLAIPDGAGVIDPAVTLSLAAVAAIQSSYREPKIMRKYKPDTISDLLQRPEVPQDIQRSVAQALGRAPNDIERRKIIGLAAKEFPEIGNLFEPSPIGLKSDFDGVIGDPEEKMAASRNLSVEVRNGSESTIAAAKFKSSLNADRPYLIIPKSLRRTEEPPPDLDMFFSDLSQ